MGVEKNLVAREELEPGRGKEIILYPFEYEGLYVKSIYSNGVGQPFIVIEKEFVPIILPEILSWGFRKVVYIPETKFKL
jgi:hypothetical protein